MKRGFTLLELIIVMGIMAVVCAIIISAFSSYRKNQALRTDTDLVIETLRQARAQTLESKNGMQYGVHFGSSAITLFPGATYSASASGNIVYPLQVPDTVVNINLYGGGSSVVFKRLSGETDNVGIVSISSGGNSQLRHVIIHATGLVDSN